VVTFLVIFKQRFLAPADGGVIETTDPLDYGPVMNIRSDENVRLLTTQYIRVCHCITML